MLKNTRNQYGKVSKIFHWGVFILVAIMLIVGFFMGDLPDAYKPITYMAHKSTGIFILGLMVLRLLWRWTNPTPRFTDAMPWWERFAARAVHALLYIVLLALPLSGWVGSTASGRIPSFYGLVLMPFPGVSPNEGLADICWNSHEILAYTLLTLLALHIMASFKHHFIDKDDILKRMMP